MKKIVDERTIDNHPDVVFRPSFDKAMFLSDDEQLDTKIFYVDEIDLL